MTHRLLGVIQNDDAIQQMNFRQQMLLSDGEGLIDFHNYIHCFENV